MFFWWKDENKDSEGIERIKRDQSVEGDAVYPKLLEVCTFLDCGGEKRIIYVNLLREGVPHHFWALQWSELLWSGGWTGGEAILKQDQLDSSSARR